jgi:LysM repeat protein
VTLPKLGLALILLPAALLAFACGGSSGPPSRTDPAKIPTATLPANLPEPLIVEGTPAAAPASSRDVYVVESGDSLYSIAERLGTTVDALMELNGLESTSLAVGQTLRIPAAAAPTESAAAAPTATPKGATSTPRPTAEPRTPSANGEEYTVQSGDNANDIALRFGITVEELAAANNKTIDELRSLQVGDVLIIPPPSATSTPEPAASPEAEATATPEG